MNDIRSIDGKFYDFTKGKHDTFLQTAYELKELGIKNYYFMLLIYNPRAADINPHNPNITEQEIATLMQELKINLWFYSRTVARIRTDKGIVNFSLHRGLAATLWCFDNRFDCCLNEPRQTWKTSGTLSTIATWAFQLSKNLKMHLFGKDSENTKRNLGYIKDYIDLLPVWLQFKRYSDPTNKIKKTQQSAKILKNKLFNNELVMHSKPVSVSHAQGMARGASAAMLIFDEIEHTPFFDHLLANSAPAFKTAADNAKAIGLPYGRIFTTTPGDLDSREGSTTLPIIQSMIPWTEKLYDMSLEEIEIYRSAFRESYHNDGIQKTREVVNIFYLEYQYFQVRKDYSWIMEQYAQSGDRIAILRELLLQRIRGSSDSPISPEDLEYLISNMVKSVNDIIINGKWRVRLYPHGHTKNINNTLLILDDTIPYIVGVDPAGGGGGDNFSITIINPHNLKIAAEFKSPYISTTEAVRMLIKLVTEHIPKAIIFPERNSMGISVIQLLAESSIRDNLYWSKTTSQIDKMAEESPDEYKLRVIADEWKKYGVYTLRKQRDMMFQILFRHINEHKDILNTEYLIEDMCKLIRTPSGSIKASNGSHDDSVMSYLIAMYLFYTGDNLQIFGIDNSIHPIVGPIETENDEIEIPVITKSLKSNFFSTADITYDEILKEDNDRVEQEIAYFRETKPLTYTPPNRIGPRRFKNNVIEDNKVDISPYFFRSLNN